MEIEINWLAVLSATVAGMICAGLWYTKSLFGPTWRQLTGISETDSQKSGNTPMIIVLFANIITAIVLAGVISISRIAFDNTSILFSLFVGFLVWLAFSATTLITHNAFEQKPSKLTWINIGYQLVLFLSMALVIGLFR
ncbi:MAG: DUF1761 domain-containing protein [Chitinophagaceae bacterium]|nr:DUF1761 domain-containing protein [Chitinophagaceae bacterium]